MTSKNYTKVKVRSRNKRKKDAAERNVMTPCWIQYTGIYISGYARPHCKKSKSYNKLEIEIDQMQFSAVIINSC